jgi:acyl-CoA dehydrogenase
MSALQVERLPALAEEDIVIFEDAVGKFFDEYAPEARVAKWREDGIVERSMWTQAAEAGLACLSIPEEYGGMGGDYRHEVVLMEQLGAKGVDGFGLSLHNSIVAPYIFHYGTEDQKRRWLPKLATCEYVSAIAMTEPGAGSDLQGIKTTARLNGNEYVINGSKTFITNGQTANLIIVVAKTDPNQGARGTSLVLVETDGAAGFERGRNLDKLGMHSQDTAELFFSDVRVPVENRIGAEGEGFKLLVKNLPQERLSIAMAGVAHARAVLTWTVDYCNERTAFGQKIGSFQNSRFKLAEMETEITLGETFIDRCVTALNEGTLTAEEAAMSKWWCTELQKRVADACVQLHGGYGYMSEYAVGRAYLDARVSSIYGGTTEIMKEIIGRSLGV